jgi:hypothetical protein
MATRLVSEQEYRDDEENRGAKNMSGFERTVPYAGRSNTHDPLF